MSVVKLVQLIFLSGLLQQLLFSELVLEGHVPEGGFLICLDALVQQGLEFLLGLVVDDRRFFLGLHFLFFLFDCSCCNIFLLRWRRDRDV